MNTQIPQQTHDFAAYLFRGNPNPEDFDTVFFVGNGAINNGNMPLEAWAKKLNTESDTFGKFFEPHDHLSTLAIQFRLCRIKSKSDDLNLTTQRIKAEKELLGRYFRLAGQDLSLRNLPEHIMHELNNEKTLVVTTNWDSTLWNQTLENLVQLHGSCARPETMILPTEYLIDFFGSGTPAARNLDPSFDMSPQTAAFMGQLHRLVINTLEKAKRIYIWGMALNSYDFEVASLFLANKNCRASPGKAWIINPDKQAVLRAGAFLARQELVWIDPTNNFARTVVHA